uniref:hypothetical protein n=1 Tax=Chitinophaga sp. TaxID=1869181 RepID=UPI0031DA328C
MIKYISILFVLILLSQHIFGRQTSLPLIDTSCARNWPIVSNGMLSNDGEFASYTISNANTQLNKHVDAIFKKIGGKW